jgi:malate dehydrogenase (oxaloacetate-decarboxylating)(NADP+)
VQIAPLSASVSTILQMATVCAYDRPLVEIDA